ncbi:hypothetical protein Q428_05475 [Fervidicella metallireducens AeB]|uniref:Uncharacterized protein n=1 Tax=Fervidicella metallireducens AeB TaxID=1403537 RepID=A0A017RY71_9CLOT|nr:hypothetical protein [Fervidicella metallireducens]EYE88890.1 hypothetical protein Q428_05475 [Fervidicella metallireducens AeB]
MAFLTTHKNKEEIENGIALNMLENYYDYKLKFFNEEYKKDIDELKKKIDSSEKTIQDLKNENEKLLKQNKQCKKELGTLENSIEVLKSKLKGYEEKTKKDKNSEGDNKENLSEIKLKNEELEKQLKEAKTMCKFLEKEIVQLQLERDELGKNLNYINAYFEYASSSIEENKNYLFALVINMDAKICSYLFPEILFIDSNKLEEELLSCSLNNINKIYIQRNNLSTLKINLIKEFAKKKRLKAKIIMPRNEKELIEEIIKIKYMEG